MRSAQSRLTRLGVPYLRPDDYFAEMLKSDSHMSKVKARMIRQQEAIFNAEQMRKQKHNKKYGKQVQREKLEAKAAQKRADSNTAMKLHKQKKENQGAPEFDIEADSFAPEPKRARTEGGRGGGGSAGAGGKGGRGGGKGKGGGMSKRDAKDAKFGKSHLRKDKRNDADSINDQRSFNRGSKSSGGRGKGAGGKGAGGRGGGSAIAKKKRPGKEARKKK